MLEQAKCFYNNLVTGNTDYQIIYDTNLPYQGLYFYKTHTLKLATHTPWVLAHESFHAFQYENKWEYTFLEKHEQIWADEACSSYVKQNRCFHLMPFIDKLNFVFFYALLTSELEANIFAAYIINDVIPYYDTYCDIKTFLKKDKNKIIEYVGKESYLIMVEKMKIIDNFLSRGPNYESTQQAMLSLEKIGYNI